MLRAKVKVLASLIRDSKNMVAYTGAGISTGAGIGDYATKAANSAAKKGQPKLHSNLDAQPTLAHCVLTALGREDHLKHWVQQNHDGLPQKAVSDMCIDPRTHIHTHTHTHTHTHVTYMRLQCSVPL